MTVCIPFLNVPYYSSQTVELPHPASSVPELALYAVALLNVVFKFEYEYKKVGLILSNLVPEGYRQPGLFGGECDERHRKLSAVLDRLNYRYGRDRVRLAGAGYESSWHQKRQWISPCYTTKWSDIMKIC